MRWFKRNIWKVGIAIADMLLLLVLMVWVPVSVAGAYQGASGLATPITGTAQATPTEDATVTALNKEKLTQDVAQQHHTLGNWFWNNGAALVSSLVLVIAGAFTLFRYLRDQRSEREKQREERQTELEKRAEERFQAAIEGLGSEREEAKIGAAILLRTFLHPGYEQFYIQTFDLAVAHLRLPRTPNPSEDPNTPLPLTTLRQALIVVFKEAFPLARDKLLKEQGTQFHPQSLDARRIQLDYAYLVGADLKQVWMPGASLRGAALAEANLVGARLFAADLSGASLIEADLSKTSLNEAILCGTELSRAKLIEADLRGAKLIGANLERADLKLAWLERADLRGANFSWARLLGASPEEALSLKDTDLREIRGMTDERLEACKAKGAIIGDIIDPVAIAFSTSLSQLPVSPSPASQSNDAQAPSAPPAQVNTPPPDTDGSSAPSSQQGPAS